MEKNLKKNIYTCIYIYAHIPKSLCYTPEASNIVNRLSFNKNNLFLNSVCEVSAASQALNTIKATTDFNFNVICYIT